MSLARKVQNFKKILLPQKKVENGSQHDRVLNQKTDFFVKEAYKALRTNLIFSLPDQGGKVVLVTSACAGEGKSLNCMNIAISFAETGAKVCVVDCDMRKPNVARLNNEKGSPGLSNVLVHINELDDVIKKSSYPNLDLIFSGDIPPNPAELLTSSKMDEVCDILVSRYDYVFIDTPPVNVVTDVSLLAGKANGVLLVVRQGQTTKEDLADAVHQLQFIKTRILGVLLNDIKMVGRKKSYKYRYRYRYSGAYYVRNFVEETEKNG